MIKEAKKEKGTDDFLGNVVLKLQVVNALIVYLLFYSSLSFQSNTHLYHVTLGSPLY